jgi:hypothetical protein
MESLFHRTPSVGRVVKKLIAINPDLGVSELIEIVRTSIITQGERAGEFAASEVIDEAKAMRIAKERMKTK